MFQCLRHKAIHCVATLGLGKVHFQGRLPKKDAWYLKKYIVSKKIVFFYLFGCDVWWNRCFDCCLKNKKGLMKDILDSKKNSWNWIPQIFSIISKDISIISNKHAFALWHNIYIYIYFVTNTRFCPSIFWK